MSARKRTPVSTSCGSLVSRMAGTAAFQNESSTGWQEAKFATPIAINKNTAYVAAVHSTSGNPAATSQYFAADYDRGVLHAPASTGTAPNGVFLYNASALPTSTWNRTNYWVDLVLIAAPDSAAPTLVDKQPAANVNAVVTSSVVTATFSEPITPQSLTFTLK